jgi:glucan phosphoethanolaminetransferase (alkaline phosphatase superfamily)
MIAFLGLVIIIIVGFIIITSMKEEALAMSKLRSIYLYLVSFVALMMIIIGLIFTVQNITDVLFPTNYYYEPLPIEKTGGMTKQEIKRYEESQKINELNQRTSSKKNVAKSIAVVVIALPTFAYHWRKIEKEKKEQI